MLLGNRIGYFACIRAGDRRFRVEASILRRSPGGGRYPGNFATPERGPHALHEKWSVPEGRRHGRPLARIYSSTEMQFKTASRSASSIG